MVDIETIDNSPIVDKKLMEKMLSYFASAKASTGVRTMSFESSHNEATKIFSTYH